MSSGSLESPNIDLYNPMAWSDVAVDFEMARSCHYTSGSGRTFAIHRAKYVEGCTSLDGLQFLGGDNSLGSGVDNIPTNYKETSFAKKNSLKDLDCSELFSLSFCSIPGHASSGSSWIRSMHHGGEPARSLDAVCVPDVTVLHYILILRETRRAVPRIRMSVMG